MINWLLAWSNVECAFNFGLYLCVFYNLKRNTKKKFALNFHFNLKQKQNGKNFKTIDDATEKHTQERTKNN